MNKQNITPEESEDSTSSNQNASVTTLEVKTDPPTLSNVTVMDVDSLNSTTTFLDNTFLGLHRRNTTRTDDMNKSVNRSEQ